MKIQIYSDGACRNNQNSENIGGYGAVILYGKHTKEIKGATRNTTNNRMEITSLIESLKCLKRFDLPVEVFMDSQYVVSTLVENWKTKANTDLWEQLYGLVSKFNDITFNKVKGHSGVIHNERADMLANIAMDNYKE